LLLKGESVKVLTRNSQRARNIIGEKPEIIEGDITNKKSVIESLRNVKAIVISISAFSRKLIRKTKEIELDSVIMLLDEAKKIEITRIVYISIYELKKDLIENLNLQQGKIKLEIEERILYL